MHLRTPVGKIDSPDRLIFGTGPYTVAAQYALVRIPDYADRTHVDGKGFLLVEESDCVNTDTIREALQFAHPVLRTGRAVSAVR